MKSIKWTLCNDKETVSVSRLQISGESPPPENSIVSYSNYSAERNMKDGLGSISNKSNNRASPDSSLAGGRASLEIKLGQGLIQKLLCKLGMWDVRWEKESLYRTWAESRCCSGGFGLKMIRPSVLWVPCVSVGNDSGCTWAALTTSHAPGSGAWIWKGGRLWGDPTRLCPTFHLPHLPLHEFRILYYERCEE